MDMGDSAAGGGGTKSRGSAAGGGAATARGGGGMLRCCSRGDVAGRCDVAERCHAPCSHDARKPDAAAASSRMLSEAAAASAVACASAAWSSRCSRSSSSSARSRMIRSRSPRRASCRSLRPLLRRFVLRADPPGPGSTFCVVATPRRSSSDQRLGAPARSKASKSGRPGKSDRSTGPKEVLSTTLASSSRPLASFAASRAA